MWSKLRGLALLEVLIAMLLIGIASLSLLKLQVYLEQRASYAVQSIEALNLVEKKLEWFRTRGADAAQSELLVADFDEISSGSSWVPPYTLSWEVVLPSSSLSTLKQLTVKGAWKDRFGESQQITVETMISEYGEFLGN